MKIVILVAGRGSRINRLTKKNPKALIKINKKTLLFHQLRALKYAGIKKKNISIVTGYQKEKFKKFKLKEFKNNEWRATNMIYSLNKANTWLSNNNCIVLYGDILYSYKAIKLLLNSKNKFCVLSNNNWLSNWKLRFSNPLKDLESFKIDKKKIIKEIGNKETKIKNIKGQFMGMFKIDPKNWKKIKLKFKENNNNISTTKLLNKLIKEEKVKIKSVDYNQQWFEIDSYNDFKIAQKNFVEVI